MFEQFRQRLANPDLLLCGGACLSLIMGQLACAAESVPEIRSGFKIVSTCPGGTDPSHFPVEYLGKSEAGEMDAGFARFLREAGQPLLWCGSEPAEAYRFLWLPSYRPAVMGGLTRTGDEWRIAVTEFVDPRGGMESLRRPWVIAQQYHVVADATGAAAVLKALDRGRFWIVPSWKDSETDDGSTWVFEGRRDDAYRVVVRYNVSEPALEESARMLLQAVGMAVPKEMETRALVR